MLLLGLSLAVGGGSGNCHRLSTSAYARNANGCELGWSLHSAGVQTVVPTADVPQQALSRQMSQSQFSE